MSSPVFLLIPEKCVTMKHSKIKTICLVVWKFNIPSTKKYVQSKQIGLRSKWVKDKHMFLMWR